MTHVFQYLCKAMVQVMIWYNWATRHYLNLCWPAYMSSWHNCVTMNFNKLWITLARSIEIPCVNYSWQAHDIRATMLHAHQTITCVVLRMPGNHCLCLSVYGMCACIWHVFCSQEKNHAAHGLFMWMNYWLNLWVPFMMDVSFLCHDVCNIMWCWAAQFSISI